MASIPVGAGDFNSKLFNVGFSFSLRPHCWSLPFTKHLCWFLIYVWLSLRHQASSNVTKLFSKSGRPSSSFDYCFQFHSTNNSCRQVGCKEQTSKQTKDYARQGSGQVCTLYQNANDMCIYHTQ